MQTLFTLAKVALEKLTGKPVMQPWPVKIGMVVFITRNGPIDCLRRAVRHAGCVYQRN
jgi:hypothetical protein